MSTFITMRVTVRVWERETDIDREIGKEAKTETDRGREYIIIITK